MSLINMDDTSVLPEEFTVSINDSGAQGAATYDGGRRIKVHSAGNRKLYFYDYSDFLKRCKMLTVVL